MEERDYGKGLQEIDNFLSCSYPSCPFKSCCNCAEEAFTCSWHQYLRLDPPRTPNQIQPHTPQSPMTATTTTTTTTSAPAPGQDYQSLILNLLCSQLHASNKMVEKLNKNIKKFSKNKDNKGKEKKSKERNSRKNRNRDNEASPATANPVITNTTITNTDTDLDDNSLNQIDQAHLTSEDEIIAFGANQNVTNNFTNESIFSNAPAFSNEIVYMPEMNLRTPLESDASLLGLNADGEWNEDGNGNGFQ